MLQLVYYNFYTITFIIYFLYNIYKYINILDNLDLIFKPYISTLYLDLIQVKYFFHHYIFLPSGAVNVPQYLKTAQAVLVNNVFQFYFMEWCLYEEE